MLRQLPNTLTLTRLVLALPLGVLILREEFAWALAVGAAAGVTDALDGYTARKLGYFSRFGAAMDPLADKFLVMITFLSLASISLIPWYVAIVIIARDLVIVAGALCYHWLIGPFDFGATLLSKFNMAVQISFCVLLLSAQLVGGLPPQMLPYLNAVVLAVAIVSGADYVVSWSRRAINSKRERG